MGKLLSHLRWGIWNGPTSYCGNPSFRRLFAWPPSKSLQGSTVSLFRKVLNIRAGLTGASYSHRLAWTLDPVTGTYSSSHPYPTRLPADPPLASHGVRQAEETGLYLSQLLARDALSSRLRIYSSLFYRCFETLRSTVEGLMTYVDTKAPQDERALLKKCLRVRGERGFGEWFGHAWFKQPAPPQAERLKNYFSWIDSEYESRITPDAHGEHIIELHDRIARALSRIIHDVDEEFEVLGRPTEHVTLLLCGHAAQIICAGRALTGMMPDDPDLEDFFCYTCGLSKFTRRTSNSASGQDDHDWKRNGGVSGGWDCVLNSDCSHLTQGAERGWRFSGDESFDTYAASVAKGPIICNGETRTPTSERMQTAEPRLGKL